MKFSAATDTTTVFNKHSRKGKKVTAEDKVLRDEADMKIGKRVMADGSTRFLRNGKIVNEIKAPSMFHGQGTKDPHGTEKKTRALREAAAEMMRDKRMGKPEQKKKPMMRMGF
jgi:hypothetical protein